MVEEKGLTNEDFIIGQSYIINKDYASKDPYYRVDQFFKVPRKLIGKNELIGIGIVFLFFEGDNPHLRNVAYSCRDERRLKRAYLVNDYFSIEEE